MKNQSTNIAALRNLGPTSEGWLNAVGIYTEDDLVQLGSVIAYKLVEQHGFAPTLNLLYALEASIRGIDWRELPPEVKEELRSAVQD